MQLTLALACGERSKLGCAPAWQLRHFSSTSLAEALAGLKILVMSPPPATCSLPAPWQFSQVTPVLAVHQRHLGVRIGGEALGYFFVAGGAGISAHEFGVRGRAAGASAALAPGGGAASAVAQNSPQPARTSRTLAVPADFPGAAPNNCVTGLFVCMQNTAFKELPGTARNQHQQPFSG